MNTMRWHWLVSLASNWHECRLISSFFLYWTKWEERKYFYLASSSFNINLRIMYEVGITKQIYKVEIWAILRIAVKNTSSRKFQNLNVLSMSTGFVAKENNLEKKLYSCIISLIIFGIVCFSRSRKWRAKNWYFLSCNIFNIQINKRRTQKPFQSHQNEDRANASIVKNVRFIPSNLSAQMIKHY